MEQVSWFDGAFPGTLPALNEAAVSQALRTAAALQCAVRHRSLFERKHYFYLDLPHGFQITQHRFPLAERGQLPIFNFSGGQQAQAGQGGTSLASRHVTVRRIQLEMDSGKSVHGRLDGRSLVDLNR